MSVKGNIQQLIRQTHRIVILRYVKKIKNLLVTEVNFIIILKSVQFTSFEYPLKNINADMRLIAFSDESGIIRVSSKSEGTSCDLYKYFLTYGLGSYMQFLPKIHATF